MTRAQRTVSFRATGDARYPYEASIDGTTWTVRVNEFPEEPSLYSLIVDGEVVEELMDWPAAWTRPGAASAPTPTPVSGHDPHEEAEYEREQAHFERTRKVGPSKLVK